MTFDQTQDSSSSPKLPKIAVKNPIKVEVKAGETYYWCSCGLSKQQPFCDGSHSGMGFSPCAYTPEKDGVVNFCGCKYSSKGAICDGSHKTLLAEGGCQ